MPLHPPNRTHSSPTPSLSHSQKRNSTRRQSIEKETREQPCARLPHSPQLQRIRLRRLTSTRHQSKLATPTCSTRCSRNSAKLARQQGSPAVSGCRGLPAALREAGNILSLALPMALSGLLLYPRSMISMLFLGRLGRLPLAGGALALGFANITGYSVLSGLASGMEPLCGQAFGANKHHLLSLALLQTILLLLLCSIPISLLWLSMRHLLLLCGQNQEIAAAAHSFILSSLPDLLVQSFLHPLRIYLRTQSITLPLTYCAAAAILLHLPINYILVSVLGLGVPGVAAAGVLTNVNLVAFLLFYVFFIYKGVWLRGGAEDGTFSTQEFFHGWRKLVGLAVPSCVTVCLEWWWYDSSASIES